jgi:cytochrome c oxidase subunit III
MNEHAHPVDLFGAKLGMWLFVLTEMLLFGGLFIAYSYMRTRYPTDFHDGGAELNVPLGVTNTLVLLTSSLTVVMSVVALRRGDKARSATFLGTSVFLGILFLVIKGIEWSAKFHHGLYPNAPHLGTLPAGQQIFFGLYFTMTGLHGLHVFVGISVLCVVLWMIATGRVRRERPIVLDNAGLYWHLVDVIWIFLLPLFYLAA